MPWETGASYVDFASEQAHYERLQGLDTVARGKDLFLLIGAGLVLGLSAVLVLLGASGIASIESIEMLYAQRRMPAASEKRSGRVRRDGRRAPAIRTRQHYKQRLDPST